MQEAWGERPKKTHASSKRDTDIKGGYRKKLNWKQNFKVIMGLYNADPESSRKS